MPIAVLEDWLSFHPNLAYLTLILGMFFETLIGTNIFIVGEAFLFAGPILAGTGILNIWFVAAALYAGAIIGDNVNYLLGKKFGAKLFKEGRWFLNPSNYEKGKQFFTRHGTKAIFLARLIGPFNLVMPFLSGVYRVPYRTFITFNTAGIVVGVGEFILAGYFLGGSFVLLFPWFASRPLTSSIIIGSSMLLIGWFIGSRVMNTKKSSEPTNI
jgi:membrane protein DedA with SNARE-associated domain